MAVTEEGTRKRDSENELERETQSLRDSATSYNSAAVVFAGPKWDPNIPPVV